MAIIHTGIKFNDSVKAFIPFKPLFMRKFKIILTTLAISFGFVISVAFSAKPAMLVDYRYAPDSGKTLIQTGSVASIFPGDLYVDNNGDHYPDSWIQAPIGVHYNGTKLMGIEFNSYELSLEDAAYNVYLYYYLFANLPQDNCVLQCLFNYYTIRIFRKN